MKPHLRAVGLEKSYGQKKVVNGVNVGVLGEVNPLVLEAWKLENPTAAFEINMQRIIRGKLGK